MSYLFGKTFAASQRLRLQGPCLFLMRKSLLCSFAVIALMLFSFSEVQAQCAEPILVTQDNVLNISDPYQLTFIHQVPKNRVDSLVAELMDYKSGSLKDKAVILESIAMTGRREAFLLMWAACLRPQIVEDLSPFGSLSTSIVHHNGHRLLNRYFLQGRADTTLAEQKFRAEVMALCGKQKPMAYYCPERNREFTLIEVQSRIDAVFSEYKPCRSPIRVTRVNIYQIHNPYEFTFLHREPRNAVDSFVHMMRFGPIDTNTRASLKTMAEGRSHEAFLFLYACAEVSEKADIGRNMFHSIANQVNIWGGPGLLNRCFLDSAVGMAEWDFAFRRAVLDHCRRRNPEMYYCHQPTVMEVYEAEMAGVDPGPYDRQIVRIIRKHSDLKKPNQGKRIEQEVLQLPFVEDVLWDGCYEKLCIYPSYYTLMVVMNIDGKKVERAYAMKGARFRYIGIRLGECRIGRSVETNKDELVFTVCSYAPGALEAARRYCIEKQQPY
jgi:hypothetical protein